MITIKNKLFSKILDGSYSTIWSNEVQEILNLVEWAQKFRPLICNHYTKHNNTGKVNKRNAGRKSYDPVAMFMLFLYQRENDLSGKDLLKCFTTNIPFIISFGQYFEQIPSLATVYRYRDLFAEGDLINNIFDLQTIYILEQIRKKYIEENPQAAEQIGKYACIDSAIVSCRKSKLSQSILKAIQNGTVFVTDLFDNPHVLSHIETDASFIKKYNSWSFGYKAHVLVDPITRITTQVHVTTASQHDVKELCPLVKRAPAGLKNIYGDSAYLGQKYHDEVNQHGVNVLVIRKKAKGKELLPEDIIHNQMVKSVRWAAEVVFSNHKDQRRICTVGSKKASAWIKTGFLLQNIKRYHSIMKDQVEIKTIEQMSFPALF